MRDCELRCRLCGCRETFEVEVHEQLRARPAALILGFGALERFGGCVAACMCHAEFRTEQRDSPFTVTLSSPRAFALPRRP